MTDRAQDTEAIRAALDENVLTIRDDGTRTTAHVAARAALDRLVARLEAAERALRIIAEAELPHAAPPAVAYRDLARAALAAAAPGETTVNRPNEWTAHNIPEFEHRESAAPGETGQTP